jgi:hypothetical protein
MCTRHRQEPPKCGWKRGDQLDDGLGPRESGFDIEVTLGPVLVRPDAPHRLGAEDVAEDDRIKVVAMTLSLSWP